MPAQFLNVDLHVESRSDLAPLKTALNGRMLWQRRINNGRHWLHGCLAEEQGDPSDAILALATMVKGLRGTAKAAWNRAEIRELDIGLQAGAERRPGEWTVNVDALQAAARVGAQIGTTVYWQEQTVAADRESKRARRAR